MSHKPEIASKLPRMSQRRLLPDSRVMPSAERFAATYQSEFLDQVIEAVERDAVVVVGMSGNPACKTAREHFSSRGIEFTYLATGGYLSRWRARLMVKLWSGWPLYPQVFVHGVLIGGAARTGKAFDSGLLTRLLDAGRDGAEAIVRAEAERVAEG